MSAWGGLAKGPLGRPMGFEIWPIPSRCWAPLPPVGSLGRRRHGRAAAPQRQARAAGAGLRGPRDGHADVGDQGSPVTLQSHSGEAPGTANAKPPNPLPVSPFPGGGRPAPGGAGERSAGGGGDATPARRPLPATAPAAAVPEPHVAAPPGPPQVAGGWAGADWHILCVERNRAS